MRRDGRWRTNSPEIQAAARLLRAEMTPAERTLWQALRGDAIDGLRFRRQHAVGRFVLDFYCASRKLAVEVDGGIHDAQQDLDTERTAALALRGIRVIRFRNEDVLGNLQDVVERIRWWAAFEPGEEPELDP
jgi:very-short-patch-repair endonuclease